MAVCAPLSVSSRPRSARLPALAAAMLAAAALAACGEKAPEAEAVPPVEQPAGVVPDAVIVDDNQEQPGRAVVSDTLPYAEVGDELVYGHFVFPSDMVEPLPAVIIIHDWWGLNDIVKTTADRLAAQGYIVLAVDLFGGDTADDVAAARRLMLRVVEDQDSASENIRQAYDFVASAAGAPKVATLGWGLGGSWALNTAMLLPGELDALVVYYGQMSDEADRLEPIDAPMLGFFGEEDRGVAIRGVRAFENTMKSLGKPVDITIYPDAGSGFTNPKGRNYDAALARQSWGRTLEFLSETLSADES